METRAVIMSLCLAFLQVKISKKPSPFNKSSSLNDEKECESKIKDMYVLDDKKSALDEINIVIHKSQERLKSIRSAKECLEKTLGSKKKSQNTEKLKTNTDKWFAKRAERIEAEIVQITEKLKTNTDKFYPKLAERIEAESVHKYLKNDAQLTNFNESLRGLLEKSRPLSPMESADKQMSKTAFVSQWIMKYFSIFHGDFWRFEDKQSFYNSVSEQRNKRIAEQLRRREKGEQTIMTKSPEAAVSVLEKYLQIFKTVEKPERRQFPDKERCLVVLPHEGDENEYDNLVTFLKHRPDSFSSNSLEKEPSLLQGETITRVSYSDRPKFRVRMNEITSIVFESAMNGVLVDSNGTEYIPIHLEDCRMFLLFPVYKGGALHLHDVKQNNKQ